MVHPSELLRNDSQCSETQFQASRENLRQAEVDVDCGLSALPILRKPLNRFAKASYFIAVIATTGALQGCMKYYIKSTVNIWQDQYTFPPHASEWIILSSDIFQGCFALLVSFWAVHYHRVAWLGVLVIFQAIAAFAFIVPEGNHPYEGIPSTQEEEKLLCQPDAAGTLGINPDQREDQETCWSSMVIIFGIQLMFGLANLAFISLGISYLDDNVEKYNSPAFIGAAVCVKFVGEQLGMYSAWISIYHWNKKIFLTPVWLTCASLLFICGVLITLYPKVLPAIALKDAVASILDEATNRTNRRNETEDERENNEEALQERQHKIVSYDFFPTMGRLLHNKILMFNILGATMIHTGYVNFDLFSDQLMQSRFNIGLTADPSGYNDPTLSQIVTNFLRPPFTAVCILTSGFVISKIRPNSRHLMIWNVSMTILATLLYGSFTLMSCKWNVPKTFSSGIASPYCSIDCHCRHNELPFTPVCTASAMTYFSPCQAGCHGVQDFNGIKVYRNCSCSGKESEIYYQDATLGPCTDDKCKLLWGLAEVNIVTISVLLGMCIVAHVLINLRCVLPKDKVMALALELTFIGLIPYVPGYLLYTFISDESCKYRGRGDTCQYNNRSFGIVMPLVTVSFMCVGVFLKLLVLFWCKNLDLQLSAPPTEPSEPSNPEDIRLVPVTSSGDEGSENEEGASSENRDSHYRQLPSTSVAANPNFNGNKVTPSSGSEEAEQKTVPSRLRIQATLV